MIKSVTYLYKNLRKWEKGEMNYVIIYTILMILLVLFLLYRLVFVGELTIEKTAKYQLNTQGFQVFKNVVNEDTVREYTHLCKEHEYKQLKHKINENTKINDLIHAQFGDGYVLQDYIWIIEKSTVHTCHRDNNGEFFNKGQKHPSYTMLIYLENMDKCLGVIPYSHLSKSSNNINFFFNEVINLKCNAGDLIIFNANLIHVGTINRDKDDHLRIQMKITHKDDLETLQYYQNFNKVLNKENPLPNSLRHVQRNFSCMFPVLSDFTQTENIRTSRGSDNGVNIGILQQLFSYAFYGNGDFYDLPNAF